MNERIKFLRSLEPRNTGQASYQAILEAAAGLFQQFPADAITLRDILSISGVSNQTLYNYFPSGRDDVAIVLFDRYQRSIVLDFANNNEGIAWSALKDPRDMIRVLCASLVHATFGYLCANLALLRAIREYLHTHRLGSFTSHTQELEAALASELQARLGTRLSKRRLPLVAHLAVRTSLQAAEVAASREDLDVKDLESSTRKMLRALVGSGLADLDQLSEQHGFVQYTPPSIAVVGAPISPAKRQTILTRIFKRKRRD